MSLLTDPDWSIQELRRLYLQIKDPIAERIISFRENSYEPGCYSTDALKEQNLCYSPAISNIVQQTSLRSRQTRAPIQNFNTKPKTLERKLS